MDRFKKSETPEVHEIQDVRVVKIDKPGDRSVQEFQFQKLSVAGQHDYKTTKAKYGALAATDADRVARSAKDARFSLNPLLRDPLAIEEEERRVIEEKVRQRVAAIADEAKAKAAEDGYRDGLKKGHDEAFQKFQEEGSARLKQFESLVNQVENAKVEAFRANERFLIEVVFRIGRMVLLRELTTDKDYVLRLARELIERVGVRENVTLRVNPADLATADMLKQGLEKALGSLQNFNIEASKDVLGGGCAIETEWHSIDASVETQLKGIHDALILGNRVEETEGTPQ